MPRLTILRIATAGVALAACRSATDPGAAVLAVDGAYTFRVAFDSLAPATGTFTLRRVGPVLRDSATGRRYQRLEGTLNFDGPVQDGGCGGAASCINTRSFDPVAQWPQYRSQVDETGQVTLVASIAGGLDVHAELAPAATGRFAGGFHQWQGAYFRDGTISAERQR